jgi:putative DNA primase/helicase
MTDERISAVLEKFKSVKETTDGWIACCPAHDDRKPSLSIAATMDKILLKCHGHCETADVLEAAGLQWKDLYIGDGGKRKLVAKYNYKNKSGKLLYQTLRYEPKSFGVRQPDGAGGWIYNINGVRRVPYRVPKLVESDRCLIVEGEKDVKTAEEMEFTATCNPFGAGKWLPEYNEHFREKLANIIPDNDDAGERHARSVACSLITIAKRVKIVHLPEGKDLSEWRELGGTRPQLIKLIKATTAVTAEQVAAWQTQTSRTTAGEFQLTKLDDLLKEPEEKVSWTVEGLLPSSGISLLVAKPKTGKSTLARQLAVRVARGRKFLGRRTIQGRVVYLALEEKRDEVRKHFTDLGVEGDEEIYLHCAAAPQAAVPALIHLVKQYKPALVIIDPVLRLIRLSDTNDYSQVNLALEPIVSLAREHSTHIVLVHHMRKGEASDASDAILGSTALLGAVDTALLMERTNHFRTIQSRQRYGQDLAESVLDFNEERRSVTLGALREDADVERIASQICKFLQKSERWKTRKEIQAEVTGRTEVMRAAFRSLVEGKRVQRTGSGAKGDPYRYMCGNKEQES